MEKISDYSFIAIVVLLLVGPAIVWSKDRPPETLPRLSAFLDKESARVGEIVTLTLRYQLPEGASLAKDPKIEGIENLTPVDFQTGDREIRIKFLVDQPDTWKTGSLSLAFLDKEGISQAISIDPVSLPVLSNLGEKPAEAGLRPIRGIIPIKARWLKYLPWATLLFVLLFAILALIFRYEKIRAGRLSSEMEESPHLRAEKEIKELEARQIFEKGDVKEFYFRLSEILRRYLEKLRGFPAAEFTTEEIASRMDQELDHLLLPLLRQADLVKFADAAPSPARKEAEIKEAFAYIGKTAPTPETGPAADGSRRLSP